MVADVSDWTKPVTLTTGGALGADFPDWTLAVQAVGGSTGGYASLTGAGQTVTPGNLTQAGGFTVNTTGSNTIFLSSTGGGGITLSESGGTTTGGIAIAAGSTHGLYLEGQGNVLISSGGNTPGPFHGSGTQQLLLFATTSIQLIYSYLDTPGTPGDNCITVADGSSGGTSVHLYTYPGSPNGHIDSLSSGDICFDPTTPALWICTVGGTNNNWHPFTYT